MKNLQRGFAIPIIIAVIALLTIGGGAYIYTNNKVEAPINISDITSNVSTTTPDNVVGGDRDAYGCIGSAGYTWCAVKNKCLRTWEEKCEITTTTTKPETVVCTMDAKQCLDGSWVGRTGPKCEFACPEVKAEKANGIIKSVYNKNGINYIDIDYVTMNLDWKPGGMSGPRYTNDNSKIRTFEISESVQVVVHYKYTTTPTQPTPHWEIVSPNIMIFADFYKNFNSDESSYSPFRGLYEIEISNNTITKIKQIFTS